MTPVIYNTNMIEIGIVKSAHKQWIVELELVFLYIISTHMVHIFHLVYTYCIQQLVTIVADRYQAASDASSSEAASNSKRISSVLSDPPTFPYNLLTIAPVL